MSEEINISQLTDSIMNLYDIYQKLEVTNDISEDNPAFDFLIEVVDGLYNTCMDLMSLVYTHPDANPEMVQIYKAIITDLLEQESPLY